MKEWDVSVLMKEVTEKTEATEVVRGDTVIMDRSKH
jgi:hypothetical protein